MKNSWHLEMYDRLFAEKTIGSASFLKKAKKEIRFLIDELELQKNSLVLDIPCGTGRHAAAFAHAGMNVTAVDINPYCLSIAKKQNAHRNLKYLKKDMSDPTMLKRFRNRFDLVANLFTSFGYFATDRQNEAVLKLWVKTVKPGGHLVIHTINRNYLLDVFQPNAWRIEKDLIVVEARHYDPKTFYNEAYMCIVNNKTGQGTARYHRIRLYEPFEMIELMRRCGLANIRTFGSEKGDRLDIRRSTHPYYIGTRF